MCFCKGCKQLGGGGGDSHPSPPPARLSVTASAFLPTPASLTMHTLKRSVSVSVTAQRRRLRRRLLLPKPANAPSKSQSVPDRSVNDRDLMLDPQLNGPGSSPARDLRLRYFGTEICAGFLGQPCRQPSVQIEGVGRDACVKCIFSLCTMLCVRVLK